MEALYYIIGHDNSVIKPGYKTKRAAMKNARADRGHERDVALIMGSRILQMWSGVTGRELTFHSHGGDHGEWR